MLVNFYTEAIQRSTPSYEHLDLDRIAVIILGGGEGKRLEPLTKSRCKPAVSFGGRYSLIDVPISHSLSSGLTHIFIVGQYLAYTLQKHLYQTYLHNGIAQNQIKFLVPDDQEGHALTYHGTADAIRKNLSYFEKVPADYFLILSGDQLYNINFQEMIRFGLKKNANLVIAAKPVGEKEASRMGLMKLKSGSTQVVKFVEKPKDPAVLKEFYLDEVSLQRLGFIGNEKRHYLCSMGIYLFKREALFSLLKEDPREDFGKHLIHSQLNKEDVHAFVYDGYWEDIGTIEAFYNANLALTKKETTREGGLLCYDENNVILTKTYRLPGAKIEGTLIKESLICEGAVIEAKEVIHSIIGVRTVIGKDSQIYDSILMGNEYYEKPLFNQAQVIDHPSIGQRCVIKKAILDENVTIEDDVKLLNLKNLTHYDPKENEPPIYVRDGIIVIPRGAYIPAGTIF